MFKRTLVAASIAAFSVLGIATTASAATVPSTNVTDFGISVTSAKIVVADLLPDGIEIPGSDPTLVGKTININGTLSKGGKVSIGTSGFDFPSIGLGDALPIPGVNLDIVQTGTTLGTFNSTTGAISLPLNLGVSLSADLGGGAGLSCLIRGLNFTFTTGNATAGTTTLFGSAWNKTTRAITITGTSQIPADTSISSAECPIKSLLAGAGVSGKAIALKLSGTTTIGTTFKIPAKTTLPSTAPKFSKGKSSVSVTCAGSSSKNRDCSGTVQLDVGTNKGTAVSYTAQAGKKATVQIVLTPAQISAIGKKSVSASLILTTDNGTGATKSVKVSNK